jgi:parvulin-like peptidyl-prolyl isomerase
MAARRLFVPVVAVLAGFAAASCARDDDAMAWVGKRRLEVAEFQEYVTRASGEPWQGVDSRVNSGLLDQFIDRQVLLESARMRDALDSGDGSRLSPAELRRLVDRMCGETPEPPPEVVASEVERRMADELPARAHVRQILVDTLEEAQSARRRLLDGADFVEVSREVSRAPNAADGGELGYVYQEGLPPEIDRVVFSLAAGEFSQPVQGTSGFHVFQVLEVDEPGPPDRAEVEASVLDELRRQADRAHSRSCIAGLAGEVGVKVNRSRLWFPYDGRYSED